MPADILSGKGCALLKVAMVLKILKSGCLVSVLVFFVGVNAGCDFVYRMLQREGAEERELVGDTTPYEKNEKVIQIQKLLRLYGYRVGQADGVLGGNTRDAIERFQLDNDLKATRFIDKATWAQLMTLEQSGLVYDGELVVKALQQALKESGVYRGAVDGKMGRMTKEAIQEFQQKKKLKPDGKIGYKTLRALAEYLP